MTAPELKPCPFCGAEAERIDIGNDECGNAGGSVIQCAKCMASSRVEFGFKENLIDAWNRRADIAAAHPAHVQPDPRDEVIARLVESLRLMRSTYPYNPPCYGWVEQVEAHKTAKAALAAAKAVMK